MIEGRADLLLADRIEMRGRFVEDQDRRVLQEGARDRNSLALTARQLHAAFADAGREALGEPVDKLAERRAVDRTPHVRLGYLAPGQPDIRRERVVEQIRVLRNERDVAAQIIQPQLAEIAAAERDAAFLRVPETQQQVGDGRFAGARCADHGHRAARPHLERHADPGPARRGRDR